MQQRELVLEERAKAAEERVDQLCVATTSAGGCDRSDREESASTALPVERVQQLQRDIEKLHSQLAALRIECVALESTEHDDIG
jgi:hypothetical protein